MLGCAPCNKGMHVDRHLLVADIQCPSPALLAGSARGHHACCAAPEACHSHPRTCASEAIASEARLAGAGAACGGDTAGGVGAAASVVLRTHVDTCISVLKIIIVKATCAARGQARRWVLALPPHGPADCCGLAKPTQLEQYCQAEDTVDQLPVCLALQEPGSRGRQQMTRQALSR